VYCSNKGINQIDQPDIHDHTSALWPRGSDLDPGWKTTRFTTQTSGRFVKRHFSQVRADGWLS
jgi:hypothetical protein